jgi:hypothetical protein
MITKPTLKSVTITFKLCHRAKTTLVNKRLHQLVNDVMAYNESDELGMAIPHPCVVWSTPRLSGIQTRNVSGDRH